jgi:hypothetical protein
MAADKGVNAVALGAVAAGLVFIWSGIKGNSIVKTFQSLIMGQKPSDANVYPISTPQGGSGGETAPDGGTDAVGGTPEQNKAIGKQLAAAYGWDSGAQWDALVKLWNRESGWNNKARNPSSGAYGIPQALPASKMGAAANPPTSSASAQIKWGLSYIKSRYGSPTAAWAHETSAGWY